MDETKSRRIEQGDRETGSVKVLLRIRLDGSWCPKETLRVSFGNASLTFELRANGSPSAGLQASSKDASRRSRSEDSRRHERLRGLSLVACCRHGAPCGEPLRMLASETFHFTSKTRSVLLVPGSQPEEIEATPRYARCLAVSLFNPSSGRRFSVPDAKNRCRACLSIVIRSAQQMCGIFRRVLSRDDKGVKDRA